MVIRLRSSSQQNHFTVLIGLDRPRSATIAGAQRPDHSLVPEKRYTSTAFVHRHSRAMKVFLVLAVVLLAGAAVAKPGIPAPDVVEWMLQQDFGARHQALAPRAVGWP